ncbi:type VII secretion system-associated protein [Streptomyces yokosukanensis]|uniref:type VII secretion system-associated protein n=1 Tax=Streptomyces yokosukanensis TaxID=67386 RepID=UPI001FC8EE3C|nr:type VII secretion system-associated protein [Streptomyces yokosukanensis]
MNESRLSVPPVSGAVRAQAAKMPGSWVYAIDPYFDPAGKVPPYGIIGAWKVDDHGNVTKEFRHNPKYRPSPRAHGMKEPTDHLDSVIQLASTGYASELDMQNAILNSVVYMIPPSAGIAEPCVQDGNRSAVGIYTSPAHAPNTVPEVQRVLFRELLRDLPEHAILKLNPHSSVSAEVAVADIRRAADQ